MVSWYVVITAICIALSSLLHFHRRRKNLPPGPRSFPVIGNISLISQPQSHLEPFLNRFMSRNGPLVFLKFGNRPFAYIGTHSLAHDALVKNSVALADRPDICPAMRAMNTNLKSINTSSFGPTWGLLRRNLTGKIIQPAQHNMAYSESRRQILTLLIGRLSNPTESSVQLNNHIDYTILSLVVLMCFGQRFPERQTKEIGDIAHDMGRNMLIITKMYVFPRLGRILFRNTLKKGIEVHHRAMRVFLPLIRARIKVKKETRDFEKDVKMLSYVDTLADLHLPEENRQLEEEEMATLCGEFVVAGKETTTATIEWIMANLVKYPECQNKLYREIEAVIGKAPAIRIRAGDESLEKVVKEGDLERIPYLKAVVLEGLRLHPPGHFALPHKLNEDVELDGYTIPENTLVNILVARMGRDPNVWEEPLKFNPERFLPRNGEEFDLSGIGELKMMPFGAGRRRCPGIEMALFHVQYIVANLIWFFHWSPIDGEEVDLDETGSFTTVMKKPLRARVSQRV